MNHSHVQQRREHSYSPTHGNSACSTVPQTQNGASSGRKNQLSLVLFNAEKETVFSNPDLYLLFLDYAGKVLGELPYCVQDNIRSLTSAFISHTLRCNLISLYCHLGSDSLYNAPYSGGRPVVLYCRFGGRLYFFE
jgi:hypothetical protein